MVVTQQVSKGNVVLNFSSDAFSQKQCARGSVMVGE
jgi:hypothetical protein